MNLLVIESEKDGHNFSLYLSSLLKKFHKKNNLFLLTSEDLYLSNNFKEFRKKGW